MLCNVKIYHKNFLVGGLLKVIVLCCAVLLFDPAEGLSHSDSPQRRLSGQLVPTCHDFRFDLDK